MTPLISNIGSETNDQPLEFMKYAYQNLPINNMIANNFHCVDTMTAVEEASKLATQLQAPPCLKLHSNGIPKSENTKLKVSKSKKIY